MCIQYVRISNFKSFRDTFEVRLHEGINLLAGGNGAGRTTILEAVALVLTGKYHGKSVRDGIPMDLFNKETVCDYLEICRKKNYVAPPEIKIELGFSSPVSVSIEGRKKSDRSRKTGRIILSIEFDELYDEEYRESFNNPFSKRFPIEFYHAVLTTEEGETVIPDGIQYSEAYVSASPDENDIRELLKTRFTPNDKILIFHKYRELTRKFNSMDAFSRVNTALRNEIDSTMQVSYDESAMPFWLDCLAMCSDGVPFRDIGQGRKHILATHMTLEHHGQNGIVLMDRIEDGLSVPGSREMASIIAEHEDGRQILAVTDSSYMANRLGLKNVILLRGGKASYLDECGDSDFFVAMSETDTLRLLLSEKVLLVGTYAEKLVARKAYRELNGGHEPCEDGLEIIAAGSVICRLLRLAGLSGVNVTAACGSSSGCDGVPESITCFFEQKRLSEAFLEANEGNMEVLSDLLQHDFSKDADAVSFLVKNEDEWAFRLMASECGAAFPAYIENAVKAASR